MKKFIPVVLLSLVLFACKKETVKSGQFMVVNASPGFGPVDIWMDANPFSSGSIPYPANTGYKPLIEGRHLMKVLQPGTSNSLFEVNMTTASDVSQSLFIYDRPTALQVFAVQDIFGSYGSGKAGLRFFHLSSGAPMVDVGTLSGGTFSPLFTARSFETSTTAFTNSSFLPVNTGTYSFQIRVNGAGAPLLTVNNIVLEEGKSYTLFAKGLSGNMTTPLGLELITNN